MSSYIQYKDILNSIQPLDVQEIKKVSLEDLMQIHPSFTYESVELWSLYLNLRPDLSEEDQNDIRQIIQKLQQNNLVKLAAIMSDMRDRIKDRPEIIPDSECIITPIENNE